ncbi:hypothetical protein BFJ70_g16637 [Fusarium oxysporum]|nr:hypothetical protein BFJ70_g16637 [Fusarium oxysporum]
MTRPAARTLEEDDQQSLSNLSRPFTTKKSFIRSCPASLYRTYRHIGPTRGARPLEIYADMAMLGLVRPSISWVMAWEDEHEQISGNGTQADMGWFRFHWR